MIHLENATITRGARILHKGVSLSVSKGQALAIQGENGSGKTTLLRLLAGLIPLRHGKMQCPPNDFLYLGHKNALKSDFTVTQMLAFWAQLYATPVPDCAQLGYDLTPLAHQPCAILSTGQARRVALSRLTAIPRPIWLLDEPTAGLDNHASHLFETALAKHLKTGGLAVIATHLPIAGVTKTLDLTSSHPHQKEA